MIGPIVEDVVELAAIGAFVAMVGIWAIAIGLT